ncbi:class I SAM-dependent methyltransferase [Rhodospirillaceae bacterium KN72]|uniref:Class I SAM-dependent methyltransferase n=1 Tax=Pacificispira spongiicola TaxID=2729598 RepID=A0A7Y0HHG8_9PROT|nr:class I SAM-dependent methyltransferase [Pacificispira spongiicola]NMM46718.1 class I SAM-dependent methyltransferase [Pacificispira spongiicola]
MKFTTEQILDLYREQAAKHGDGGTSTIQDIRTRVLEIEALAAHLSDGEKVLEVGCGNGFVAEELVKLFSIDLDAFDFSPDMIEIAQKRKIENAKGHVSYAVNDVLKLDADGLYDTVLSERCIQNLVSWDDQKVALENIVRALKPGGQYVMLESFWTGLNNLNEARGELDLEEIPESWHNLFFDEDKTIAEMERLGCSYVDQNPFLSGYYFGSRVLLPALMPKGKKVTSNSRLNDYFSALPPAGDFCPMKIVRFRKN